jgi:predicted nucleic acid-binding protein
VILYCDTSALIKRYVEEEGTEIVDRLWSASLGIATSVVAFAETASTFSRKLREGILTEREYVSTLKMFKTDFDSFILVSVTPMLNSMIERLVMKYPLRGFDAIHLSSALMIKDSGSLPVQFACFDRTLNEAGLKEGLTVAVEK